MRRALLGWLLALGCAGGLASRGAAQTDDQAGARDELRFEVLAGAGIGTRGLQRPTASGVPQRLDDAVFPAVDLALRAHAWPDDGFSLALQLRYQTSLGLSVQEQPAFALPNEVDVRAERIELGAAPVWRLGEGAPLWLAVPLGVTLRALWPDVRELTTPAYSLAGPHVRVELWWEIAPSVSLRAGPELHAIVVLDESLKNGGTESYGFAFGGEAALRLLLSDPLGLELSYRESHAFVGHRAAGVDFEDTERFATLRLSGAL